MPDGAPSFTVTLEISLFLFVFLHRQVNLMACNAFQRACGPCGFGPPLNSFPCPGTCPCPCPCPCPPPLPPAPPGPQVVFQAVSSFFNNTQVSSQTPVIVPFNQIRTGNLTNSFSILTSTFVAPVRGFYEFDVALSAAAVAQTPAEVIVSLVVNGNVYNTQTLTLFFDATVSINFSSIVSLNPSDSVWVTWSSPTAAGAAALQTAIYPAGASTWFEGKSLF